MFINVINRTLTLFSLFTKNSLLLLKISIKYMPYYFFWPKRVYLVEFVYICEYIYMCKYIYIRLEKCYSSFIVDLCFITYTILWTINKRRQN